MRAALVPRYHTVKPFPALLGESKALSADSGGKRVRTFPAPARRKAGVRPLPARHPSGVAGRGLVARAGGQ